MPETMTQALEAADAVIERTGGEIRLGMPLGLGKPNRFVNALYRRASENPRISLEIFTALTLGRPAGGSELEKRFLEPFVQRVYGDYEEPAYLQPMRRDQLPDNIRVYEFFFQPAAFLRSRNAQRNYISVNYTHAARDINGRGINVVAQMLAVRESGEDREYSFSCNPEVTLELLPLLKARRDAGETILAVGQIHPDLPFMENDARVGDWLDEFDILVDDPASHNQLLTTPNMPVQMQDHFVGLHASTLIRDGGTLQIGIGALGDALVHHALRRHHEPDAYRRVLDALTLSDEQRELIRREGGDGRFEQGLYGCSEMITHGLQRLVDEGVIRRSVYAWPALQSVVLDEPDIRPGLALLDRLREQDGLESMLTPETLGRLQHFGILDAPMRVEGGQLILPDGGSVANDLADADTRNALAPWCGERLQRGIIMHGGFFLGPESFYQRLRDLDDETRAAINMTRIGFVNHLYGDESLKRLQRRDARFMNTAFTVTLLGAGVSDQIDDGRVLSGVGGQYNFVSQGHELHGARSALMLRAWRERDGEAQSNIVFSYPHNTIPRHLRDLVITEYGVADLRGKTDEEVVMALLNIADSRFQDDLARQAQEAGKLRPGYRVPERFRNNTPERLRQVYDRAEDGAFPSFPLGTDFDEVEQRLIGALTWLKERMGHRDYLELGRQALSRHGSSEAWRRELERMGLMEPGGWRERLYQRLLITALDATG